jgi:hypothetical protein
MTLRKCVVFLYVSIAVTGCKSREYTDGEDISVGGELPAYGHKGEDVSGGGELPDARHDGDLKHGGDTSGGGQEPPPEFPGGRGTPADGVRSR